MRIIKHNKNQKKFIKLNFPIDVYDEIIRILLTSCPKIQGSCDSTPCECCWDEYLQNFMEE
jgi:hypothetical protein